MTISVYICLYIKEYIDAIFYVEKERKYIKKKRTEATQNTDKIKAVI
jgi:hypothetical protein